MYADVENPFVVSYSYSTDGHFTKQFGGKKLREGLGKVLPLAMQSDAVKWKLMLKDPRYTQNPKKGFVQKQNRDRQTAATVWAYEFTARRIILPCAVLACDMVQVQGGHQKLCYRIQSWFLGNSGGWETQTRDVAADEIEILFDTQEHH